MDDLIRPGFFHHQYSGPLSGIYAFFNIKADYKSATPKQRQQHTQSHIKNTKMNTNNPLNKTYM